MKIQIAASRSCSGPCGFSREAFLCRLECKALVVEICWCNKAVAREEMSVVRGPKTAVANDALPSIRDAEN